MLPLNSCFRISPIKVADNYLKSFDLFYKMQRVLKFD